MCPLTTTTARIDACNPCEGRRSRAAQLLGITEPSDDPISYEQLLDTIGLHDTLWCCRAEPDLSPIWRRYAVWCARQVQHFLVDQRLTDALDVAERHANGRASDEDLAAAEAATWAAGGAVWTAPARTAATRDAAWAALHAAVASWAAWETARTDALEDNPAGVEWEDWRAFLDAQAAAFRQLVTTGTLP
jgi:hypothetical protein